MSELGVFEGQTVAAAVVKITRAGDGLSEALKLEPEAISQGEEVFLVLRGQVTRVGFEPVPKAESYLRRVHTIEAREVARVGEKDVQALLDAEADRIKKLREEAEGVQRLPETDPLNIFGGESDSAATPEPVGSGV